MRSAYNARYNHFASLFAPIVYQVYKERQAINNLDIKACTPFFKSMYAFREKHVRLFLIAITP